MAYAEEVYDILKTEAREWILYTKIISRIS